MLENITSMRCMNEVGQEWKQKPNWQITQWDFLNVILLNSILIWTFTNGTCLKTHKPAKNTLNQMFRLQWILLKYWKDWFSAQSGIISYVVPYFFICIMTSMQFEKLPFPNFESFLGENLTLSEHYKCKTKMKNDIPTPLTSCLKDVA